MKHVTITITATTELDDDLIQTIAGYAETQIQEPLDDEGEDLAWDTFNDIDTKVDITDVELYPVRLTHEAWVYLHDLLEVDNYEHASDAVREELLREFNTKEED